MAPSVASSRPARLILLVGVCASRRTPTERQGVSEASAAGSEIVGDGAHVVAGGTECRADGDQRRARWRRFGGVERDLQRGDVCLQAGDLGLVPGSAGVYRL